MDHWERCQDAPPRMVISTYSNPSALRNRNGGASQGSQRALLSSHVRCLRYKRASPTNEQQPLQTPVASKTSPPAPASNQITTPPPQRELGTSAQETTMNPAGRRSGHGGAFARAPGRAERGRLEVPEGKEARRGGGQEPPSSMSVPLTGDRGFSAFPSPASG